MTKRHKAFKQTLKFLKAYNEALKRDGKENKEIKREAVKALDVLFPEAKHEHINIGDNEHNELACIPPEDEYGECEKCGGETSDRLIGDETYNKCGDCGWITH